jgi:hypothetical protein
MTRTRVGRLLVATVASATMLLVSATSAQAAWQPPGTTDSRWHCGDYNTALNPIWFQDCVIVTPTASGAYVQSVVAVANRGSTAYGLYAMTRTFLGSTVIVRTDCGYAVIDAFSRKWCWGETRYVSGHDRAVFGEGWVGSSSVRSRTWWT